jgi:hypothetical protein
MQGKLYAFVRPLLAKISFLTIYIIEYKSIVPWYYALIFSNKQNVANKITRCMANAEPDAIFKKIIQ